MIAMDNTSVVPYINKLGSTRSSQMYALLWQLMAWCTKNMVSIKARHIPGCLNVLTDSLSRRNQIQSTEWPLNPTVVKSLFKRWGTPHVDLFAMRHNHKLSLFLLPVPDPLAWEVEALHQDWTGLMGYAYPPTALLSKILTKVYNQQCDLILIAPGWPGMPWFWDLVRLSLQVPLRLPPIPRLLKQPT